MKTTYPIILLALLLVACDGGDPAAARTADGPPLVPSGPDRAAVNAPGPDAASRRLSLADIQSRLGLRVLTEPWTGDLDGMVERRVVRVLTVYGVGRYFLDGPQEKGITYELMKLFEDRLNERLGTGHLRVHVVFIPVSRDQLIPGLLEGRGDIVAAGLTITAERLQQIDFSEPVSKPLSEILVTGPSAPAIATLADLSGRTVHVRLTSSYHESLVKLSERLESEGRPPIDIQPISEQLEDEDLLEMVGAGLLPWVVVDDYKAEIWKQVFPQLELRTDLVLREAGQIGYAFRKGSPRLAAALDDFLATHRQGTMLGNVIVNRYLKEFDWVRNALNPEDFERFENLVGMFRRYGEEYGMDYLLVTAQGFQESRLDQSKRSPAGAIGVMQLLPETAADPKVGIPDITKAEANIHAGIRYLDHLRSQYFDDPGMDRFNQTLLALAAYNAGPNRMRGLREKAAAEGFDPNRWFGNVEVIAAREIGRETVQYVANIYKYYITYRMAVEQMASRAAERRASGIE